MEPSFDAWSLFFLIAAGQGIFLSILLFARRSPTNDLLAWLILSFSLCMGYYVVFWTGYARIWPWQLGVFQGTTLLFGPLTYFYILSDKKRTYFDARHLIPVILYTIYFLADHPPRFMTGWILAAFQIAHLLIYVALIWRKLSNNRNLTNGALKRHKWQQKIGWAYTGYTVSFILYFILAWTGLIKIEHDFMISLISAGLIYFIGYNGFMKSEVLRMNEESQYNKSTLSPRAAQSILEKVKKIMLEENMYLNSDLKLQDVATRLDLLPHHISQSINELEERNFSDFINEYRISKAIRLLKTTENKVIHIAYDSGFNNKASFNNAFKKVTGMSPSQYRDTHQSITMR